MPAWASWPVRFPAAVQRSVLDQAVGEAAEQEPELVGGKLVAAGTKAGEEPNCCSLIRFSTPSPRAINTVPYNGCGGSLRLRHGKTRIIAVAVVLGLMDDAAAQRSQLSAA